MSAKKNFIKKIILGIFISLFLLALTTKTTKAFETPNASYPFEFQQAIESDDMNLQSFVNETMKAIAGSITRFIFGGTGSFDFIKDLMSEKPNTSQISKGLLDNQGLIGTSGMIITGFFVSPPASGIQYLADIGRDLRIIKPAMAEENPEIGVKLMRTLLPIWKIFRNLSYILFVLIIIGMGFAIMFRLKVSPQAVITFQIALPRIILALILITFSYAIVGLLIDAAIYLSSLIASLFKDILTNEVLFGQKIFSVPITLLEKLISGDSSPFAPKVLGEIMRPFTIVFIYNILAGLTLSTMMLVMPGIGIILGLIIGILLLIAFFRAIWTLLRAFAMIVINLIFAPFRILIGVLPTSNAITDWFKDLFANIAVFPIMITMLLLGDYLIIAGAKGIIFSGALAINTAVSEVTQPTSFLEVIGEGYSFIGSTLGYGIFYLATSLLLPLIGIMVIFMIPKVSDIIQSFITKKPFDYGTAIGQTMGPVVFAGKTGATGGASFVHKVGREIGWWKKGTPKGKAADAIKDFIQGQANKR